MATVTEDIKTIRIKRARLFCDKFLFLYKGKETVSLLDLLIEIKLALNSIDRNTQKNYASALYEAGLVGINVSEKNTEYLKAMLKQVLKNLTSKHKDGVYFNSVSEEYKEFSTFYESEFTLGFKKWNSAEHYFQAMKTSDVWEQDEIRKADTPAEARKKGATVTQKEDWDLISYDVMFEACKAKFSQNEALKKMLIDTSGLALHEDSKNPIWGYTGKDLLGKILMQIRFDLSPIELKILNQ